MGEPRGPISLGIFRHLRRLAATIGEKVRLVTPFQEFQSQAHSRGRGRAAEDDGIAWLEGQGFTILARNVATRLGEIDVVAREGETLCFVEIKARSSGICGEAAWAVPARKQGQIGRVATLYLARHPHDGPCRFDVLAMDSHLQGWRYTLIRDAFELA
jgi:putative endonuclease